ncbi:MAG TPA: single-stranded DNA-binding protein [Micromonosporaceae bacterium]|jgi:single-strand DNA-binding protein
MFDTYVTIVGNVLTAPEWRRTSNTGALVARFKVASTARRMDRESGKWVDGNSFRVRVNCWRRLAEGVSASVMTGDPVVVVGRLYTRDWTDQDNNHRTLYELDAVAVGHDLSRGRGKFVRNRPTGATNSIEDQEAEGLVQGEAAEALTAADAPVRYGEHGFADDDDPGFAAEPVSPATGYEPYGRADAFETFAPGLGGNDSDDELSPLAVQEAVGGGGGGDLDGGDVASGDTDGDGASGDTDGDNATQSATSGRGRRGRGRAPVPA